MSDLRTRPFTIRLTPDDQAVLDALCQHYGLSRPDSLRRALRQALPVHSARLSNGTFTSPTAVFAIRFLPEAAHD